MSRVKDVIAALEAIAPPCLAMDGDPIGLHAGDPERRVNSVTLALDASHVALEAATRNRSGMLLVHHPRFYRGLATLAETDVNGHRAAEIVRSGLAVYSAHTNFDAAPEGTNAQLAKAAGLENRELVVVHREERLLKLAVFVPASHMQQVLRALCDAGAGAIGNYSDCTFRTRGTGTFRCGKGTKPFQGRPGSFEEADEYRLETVFGEFSREHVVASMLKAHPYEEVAYDLYALEGQGRKYGFGLVGTLPAAEQLIALARRMARATGSTMAQYYGTKGRPARRVAVWAGAGVDARALAASKADVVIAGEVGYHDVEAFRDCGINLITLGHGFSEELALKPLAAILSKKVRDVKFHVAKRGLFGMHNL